MPYDPDTDPWLRVARSIDPKHTDTEAAFAACVKERDALKGALEADHPRGNDHPEDCLGCTALSQARRDA